MPVAVHVCEEVKIMWTYYLYLSACICVLYSCVTHVLCVFPPTHARVAFTGVNRFLADRYALKRVYVYMYIHTHTHTKHTRAYTVDWEIYLPADMGYQILKVCLYSSSSILY